MGLILLFMPKNNLQRYFFISILFSRASEKGNFLQFLKYFKILNSKKIQIDIDEVSPTDALK